MKLIDFIAYARKFLVALTAALGVLAVALSDGTVSTAEIIQIVIAFAGALGVYGVSNAKQIK